MTRQPGPCLGPPSGTARTVPSHAKHGTSPAQPIWFGCGEDKEERVSEAGADGEEEDAGAGAWLARLRRGEAGIEEEKKIGAGAGVEGGGDGGGTTADSRYGGRRGMRGWGEAVGQRRRRGRRGDGGDSKAAVGAEGEDGGGGGDGQRGGQRWHVPL